MNEHEERETTHTEADKTITTLDDLLAIERESDSTPDTRPWMFVWVVSNIDPSTRPPTVEVLLLVAGRPKRIYRTQRAQTTAAAIMWVLADLVRSITEPTCVSLTISEPTIIRLLAWEIATPAWLRGPACAYFTELIGGDVSVEVEQLECACSGTATN